uniref:Uncharacterized protein n=1 Tax=Arundo donax TaxID=35708 RepID=A0A0A8YLS2_ARUDO
MPNPPGCTYANTIEERIRVVQQTVRDCACSV